MAINNELWNSYIQSRTQGNYQVRDGKVYKKHVEGGTDADNDGFDDTAVDQVNLSDGLSATELQTLTGSVPTQIDQVIDDGWVMSGRAGFDAITEADLTAAETGMFAWAEAHGLPHQSDADKGKIRSLYYSRPDALHSENSATVSQARTTAQQALQGKYTEWQGREGNAGKSFAEYLATTYPNIPEPMKSATSAEELLRFAYLSTFDSSAQEAYGLTPITQKYSPVAETVYSYDAVETWLNSFTSAPAERAEDADEAGGDEPAVAVATKTWDQVKDDPNNHLVANGNDIIPATGYAWADPENPLNFAVVENATAPDALKGIKPKPAEEPPPAEEDGAE